MQTNTVKYIVKNLAKDPLLPFRGRGYVLIKSHMRSRSSLLSHLLGSHPEIAGYMELHLPYRGIVDQLRAKFEIADATEARLDNNWLLDKILHNYPFRYDTFRAAGLRELFLLRDPLQTLRSIYHMKQNITQDAYVNFAEIGENYCARLQGLVQQASDSPGGLGYLDSEVLLTHPSVVVMRLTQWLGLTTPLGTRYQNFKHTGKADYGDPSERISAGEISQADSPAKNVAVPPAIAEIAIAAHQRCRNALLERMPNMGEDHSTL